MSYNFVFEADGLSGCVRTTSCNQPSRYVLTLVWDLAQNRGIATPNADCKPRWPLLFRRQLIFFSRLIYFGADSFEFVLDETSNDLTQG